MSRRFQQTRKHGEVQSGFTLLELIIACALLMVLATAALPTAKLTIRREKEVELRLALREIRTAIDRYKDAADRNLFRIELGSEGYPPDLETLVQGITIGPTGDRRLRFLRSIPMDPMTGKKDWGLRAIQDDPDSTGWGGKNVFDVYSRSTGIGLDGSKYSDW